MLLNVRDLSVGFPSASIAAVKGISFSIADGECFGLVGESGSGKSVTSLAIMRLLPPQARVSGAIEFGGLDLLSLDPEAMRRVRGGRIAMIFQEPMTALNPVMRVGDQIAEAVLAHSGEALPARADGSGASTSSESSPSQSPPRPQFRPRASKAEAYALALRTLAEVAIPEPDVRARDYPHQLSGGMRQRVMIAMAIVNHPQLLIADEPTTALDVTIQAQVLELLAELRRQRNLAMLFISHDLGVLSRVADRVAVMLRGEIVESGSLSQVFTAASHAYTRGLLAAVPSLRSDRSQPLKTISELP